MNMQYLYNRISKVQTALNTTTTTATPAEQTKHLLVCMHLLKVFLCELILLRMCQSLHFLTLNILFTKHLSVYSLPN